MSSSVWAAAWYRFKTTFASSWGGYVSIVVLIGLLGGVSMASFAAARRTQSSYPIYLASTNASDLSASVYVPSTGGPVSPITQQLARLSDVRALRTVEIPHAVPLDRDGAPKLSVLSAVNPLASLDGEFSKQDRLSVLQGRLADRNRADEFMVDANAARLLHLHVGERMPVGIYSSKAMSEPGFGSPKVPPTRRIEMKLVGIVVLNNQVLEDDVDRQYGFVFYTPALLREDLRIDPADRVPYEYEMRLKHGARDVSVVEQQIRQILPPDATAEFHVISRVEAQVELSLRPLSLAIGGFASIAALACLVLGLQAIGRALRERDEDRRVLRSLGAPRTTVASEALIGVLGAVVLGAVAAAGIAVVASPISPLGPIRPVFPERGVDADWLVLGVGVVGIVIVLGGSAIAWSFARASHLATARSRLVRRSSVARAVEAVGMPVTCAVGTRLALEPGSGGTAVPLRSTLFGTAVAVALVVTTLTFSSSFQTLVTHPALYGWNWSYALEPSNALPPAAQAALNKDPDVEAWTGVDYNDVSIDRLTVPVLMERSWNNRATPPILSGHSVDGPRQIVLGAATLAALHKHVGQTVTVSFALPKDAPLYVPATPLVIVGVATFPAIGYESLVADHTSMGTGAMFNESFFPSAFKRALTSRDPQLRGPELAFVRLRPGVSEASGHRDMVRIAAIANRVFAADPNGFGNSVLVLGVQRPAQIVSYRSIASTPLVLAISLAIGALLALGLTLIASVRRRRNDLALLKALGFTPRQLASSVAWQASVAALVGVVVGLPIGIVLGRQLWILFARGLNAVPYPTVPALLVVIVAFGSLVFANLVAAIPGRSAGRTSTASLLRND